MMHVKAGWVESLSGQHPTHGIHCIRRCLSSITTLRQRRGPAARRNTHKVEGAMATITMPKRKRKRKTGRSMALKRMDMRACVQSVTTKSSSP